MDRRLGAVATPRRPSAATVFRYSRHSVSKMAMRHTLALGASGAAGSRGDPGCAGVRAGKAAGVDGMVPGVVEPRSLVELDLEGGALVLGVDGRREQRGPISVS
mmetsp:Transcript_53943/g.143593  ORF Transcript_53943/g.143593 Transcript_53943/m.143593 type:complete len:104 (+) Transcript_53943:459-770(+)